MKKWQRRIRPWLINHLSLPPDVMLELPRITIIGDIHIYVENHRGLLTFTNTELQLKSANGAIQIIGSSFVMKTMLPKEILLEGKILEVKFIMDA
ncbi:sporulation protein YqfC [Ornithinibacillus gellani]|uniref:sporulation protein YqfC n=1 Tax=Ornithinibacillus gellani TaxID=2293253 RepID=UPI000F47172E|nr:sporulation protein YqfC [Ornithinibacillus gellani]TQS74578.1 sporulation protein YqfC [Ornithinibacillus gellani]